MHRNQHFRIHTWHQWCVRKYHRPCHTLSTCRLRTCSALQIFLLQSTHRNTPTHHGRNADCPLFSSLPTFLRRKRKRRYFRNRRFPGCHQVGIGDNRSRPFPACIRPVWHSSKKHFANGYFDIDSCLWLSNRQPNFHFDWHMQNPLLRNQ